MMVRQKPLFYLAALIVTALSCTVLMVRCSRWMDAEIIWDPHDPQNQAAMRGIALTSKPLFSALKQFHHDHYRYPQSIDQLYPLYLTPVPEDTGIPYRWQGWRYMLDDPSSYRLEHKLNWSDQDIEFNSVDTDRLGVWIYDNGGGHFTELPEFSDIHEP